VTIATRSLARELAGDVRAVKTTNTSGQVFNPVLAAAGQ
jgi:hypothetical protein